MNKVLAIGLNTFKESIRDRIFYSLLFFAVILVFFSIVLGKLTIGDPMKIIKDFGLGAISIGGTLIAIFVGIGMVYKEMEKRTIYIILSKPLARWQFLLGKYLGLSLTILVEVAVMTILLFSLCVAYEQALPWILLTAIGPIYIEILIILAFAVFFSAFSSPFLSGMFTLAIFIIGHFTQDLRLLAKGSQDTVFKALADGAYYILPNLERLNYKTRVVHDLAIPVQELGLSFVYALCYAALILTAAVFVFERRDIP
ncbi:ABC transporter permease [Desulfobacter vibrioformis]|uniref:ABC transporter permease n=1 Tax=Desulfobacter vibrioformis TaxID=34031 RepID=UPI0005531C95|nr:ABC transporter permease subunit [Desulfobacter vibrioformis]